jgi:tRNA-guanine family transglycosylase
MFQHIKTSSDGARLGIIKGRISQVKTPMFSMIYNFGGGGSDVYRISSYLDLFKEIPIMMMNWYYLTGGGTFKVKWIEHLDKFEDIFNFLKFIQEEFLKRGMVKHDYKKSPIKWRPIMMVDSGSGNILRDLVERSLDYHKIAERFFSMIPDYVHFSMKLSFDIMIALDFSRKYTYKKGESESKYYQRVSKELASDIESNLKLLHQFLMFSKNFDDRKRLPMIFAPLRGFTIEQYVACFKKILKLEEKTGQKFDGFAIAGLGEYRGKEASIFIGRVAKVIRERLNKLQDDRPLHALAVGGIQKIIPLTIGGVDTFDCMTPWRRATDGNMSDAIKVFNVSAKGSFSKYLIPMLNSKLEVIKENAQDVWKYVDLPKVSNDMVCDCEVCKKFQIKEVKELYSHGNEDYYFARILLFIHALLQHIYLCRRISKDIEENNTITQLINEIPDEKLKREFLRVLDCLKSSSIENFFEKL